MRRPNSRPFSNTTEAPSTLRDVLTAAPISSLSRQHLRKQAVHLVRRRLALRSLHDLAHEEPEQLVLAPAELRDLVGIRVHHLPDETFDRAGVADDRQAALLVDFLRGAFA